MTQENEAHRERKLVVAGLLYDSRNAVLLTKRTEVQPYPNQWEFPGGKMEPGESPEQALRRELMEEIAVEVEVGRVWDVIFHHAPLFDVLMMVFVCRIVGYQEPSCLDVADWSWVAPSELQSYDILQADTPLVERLCKEGLNGLRTYFK